MNKRIDTDSVTKYIKVGIFAVVLSLLVTPAVYSQLQTTLVRLISNDNLFYTNTSEGSTVALHTALVDPVTGTPITYTSDARDAGQTSATTLRTILAQTSPWRFTDLDETDEEIKDTAGELCSFSVTNPDTTTIFVHFYDADADDVTVGSTTPVMSFALGGFDPDDVPHHYPFPNGCVRFANAITAAATTTLGGSTGPTGTVVGSATFR